MKKYTIIFFLLFVYSLFSQNPNYTVSKERLLRNLKKLSEFGINKYNGNDRVAYSNYDIHADNEYLFRLASDYDQLDILKWLYSRGNVDIHVKKEHCFIGYLI
mgnify:CR=1 FL=1